MRAVDHIRRLAYQYRSLSDAAALEGDHWSAKGLADTAKMFEVELERMEAPVGPPQDPFRGFREESK